jgi:hypothetical protein
MLLLVSFSPGQLERVYIITLQTGRARAHDNYDTRDQQNTRATTLRVVLHLFSQKYLSLLQCAGLVPCVMYVLVVLDYCSVCTT